MLQTGRYLTLYSIIKYPANQVSRVDMNGEL